MKKIPGDMRDIIGENIRALRTKSFPGHGGSKKCAAAFGVSQQQWSPWERGARTPDGIRLEEMAEFFNVPVEYFYTKHVDPRAPVPDIPEDFLPLPPARNPENPVSAAPYPPASENTPCPHCRAPVPGQPSAGNPWNRCGIAESVSGSPAEVTITISLKDPDAINFILEKCIRNRNPLK